MSGYTDPVVVDWCIAAKIKRIKGKPQKHMTEGSAEGATSAMIAWLQQRDGLGDQPSVMVTAELTSDQLPGWMHEVESCIEGMPADEAIEYTIDWLVTVKEMENWGGGR